MKKVTIISGVVLALVGVAFVVYAGRPWLERRRQTALRNQFSKWTFSVQTMTAAEAEKKAPRRVIEGDLLGLDVRYRQDVLSVLEDKFFAEQLYSKARDYSALNDRVSSGERDAGPSIWTRYLSALAGDSSWLEGVLSQTTDANLRILTKCFVSMARGEYEEVIRCSRERVPETLPEIVWWLHFIEAQALFRTGDEHSAFEVASPLIETGDMGVCNGIFPLEVHLGVTAAIIYDAGGDSVSASRFLQTVSKLSAKRKDRSWDLFNARVVAPLQEKLKAGENEGREDEGQTTN